MNKVKVAINGFGRIGRLIFRQIYDLQGLEVVAVNDLTSPAVLAHKLKYDTAQGRFHADVINGEGSIVVNSKMIKVYAQKDPSLISWKDHDVDIVLESTGYFANKDKASAHLAAGARKVIISASATGELKTIVFNVNHQSLDGSETIISCGSSITHGLAPMAKVLDDHFGIVNVLMTTLHAYTNDQKTQDSPHPKGDLRRARAAAHNIISGDAGVGRVLPNLKGKMDGVAHRVPVLTGSMTELTCILKSKFDDEVEAKKRVNAVMKAAANESFGYTEDEIVSSDVIGMTYGSLFDATQTKVQNRGNIQLVRTVAWFDNEMGYVNQLVRTLKYFTGVMCDCRTYTKSNIPEI